jgi:signal transduction histidine kinase
VDAVVTAHCAPDPLDAATLLVGLVVRDVTAERHAEREIRRQNEELEARIAVRARELAARTLDFEAASREESRFLAALSHEVRTPITAMVGYADLLDAEIGGPLTAAQHAYVDRLRASTGQLLSLVDGVRDLSKVESGRVPLNTRARAIHAIVEDALSLVRPQAEAHGVRLVHTCAAAADPVAEADERRVRQVLVNLLASAVRHTPADGVVTVRCGRADAPPWRCATAGHVAWAWTAVADTGAGIPAGALATLFEPYEQGSAPERSGASGLGLAISRRLARLMGGDLVAESEPGRGSVFTLWLPAGAPAAAPAG